MFDRTACHLALDCVLDEIEADENFASFSITPTALNVYAQNGHFSADKNYDIDDTYYASQKFKRHHAYAIMRQFDELKESAGADADDAFQN